MIQFYDYEKIIYSWKNWTDYSRTFTFPADSRKTWKKRLPYFCTIHWENSHVLLGLNLRACSKERGQKERNAPNRSLLSTLLSIAFPTKLLKENTVFQTHSAWSRFTLYVHCTLYICLYIIYFWYVNTYEPLNMYAIYTIHICLVYCMQYTNILFT